MAQKREQTIDGRKCFIYDAGSAETLLIQPIEAHDFDTMDSEVELIEEMSRGRTFTMAMFMVDWNNDLPPWEAEPVFGDEAFGAGAPKTLEFVAEHLIFEVAGDRAPEIFLGGYSLAGLFALWAGYQTDRFAGIAGASPSVWYPGWPAFVREHALFVPRIYLSFGTKEEKVRNPVMKTVGDNIRSMHEILTNDAACRDVILEMNPGNHFREPDLRMAKGFAWLMNDR